MREAELFRAHGIVELAPDFAARAECESTRGEWGGICPDCGQRLPGLPKPLGRERPVYARAGLPRGGTARALHAWGIGRAPGR